MLNHHFVEINAPVDAIYREIVLWGESEWWPDDSPMKYSRSDSGKVKVGTRFRQKVHRPFAPEWDVEVISITPGYEISRRFISGMFRGTDRVYIAANGKNNEVHFLMDYEIIGSINRVLWKLAYRRMHDENITRILRAMKAELEDSEI
ncbi:MAG: SRPBCC family protein [Nitrospirota bacterium]